AKVQSHYLQSPQPVHTHAYSPYPYDLYYCCLYNLYHNPLVSINFGSQRRHLAYFNLLYRCHLCYCNDLSLE
ncbi:hypothetical protein DD922_15330, partial [Staphylococcus pseudintermedius]